MPDDNLFDKNKEATPAVAPATPEVTPAPSTPTASDQLLAAVINEHGEQKYSNVEEALKGLINANQHIVKIEGENNAFRQTVKEGKTMEEILEAVQTPGAEPVTPVTPAPASIDESKLSDLVLRTINQNKANEEASANVTTVTDKCAALYGEKAEETFYTKAAEAGFTREGINTLSRSNPKAVFKLLDIDSTPIKPELSDSLNPELLPNTPKPKRSAMAHGTTKELVASWRATKEEVNEQLAKQGIV